MNLEIYKDKKVFITGHTGFKGSWISLWLKKLNAEIVGYSLPPQTSPNHFDLLNLDIDSHYENICNLEILKKTIQASKPEIIFHLAAQPLVRESYLNPVETYQTNVMGTINLMEAARHCDSVKVIVIITTDKCYENKEQLSGYKETDRMGGFDPYSSSKGCAELVASSYRNSFFNINEYKKTHEVLVATVRAGNVIGGGDWSKDRLIPDLIRAASKGETTKIRYPNATRPWQHVLEPLAGYLMLGKKLLEGDVTFSGAWNFGPEENQSITVGEVLNLAGKYWQKIRYEEENSVQLHEAGLLSLNIDKAKFKLGWKPLWNNQVSIRKTIEWYKSFYESKVLVSEEQLNLYIN
jgi:CDP-glucose 4,6-dehydratase